jgi:hypothetical protein
MALEMDLPTHTSTAAAKLMHIKLTMCLFFYMALGLFWAQKALASFVAISGPKKSQFS